MLERIIIAGAGGQGIMLLGKVLAEAAMRENKRVTFMPTYGAEVRGGTSYCMVIISDSEIASPYVKNGDTLIVMNGPSLNKFKDRIGKSGLIIINSSLAGSLKKPACRQVSRPFTDIALELGNIKVANMAALGCYISQRKVIGVKTALEVIKELAPPEKKHLVEINNQAIMKGAKLK